MDYVVGIIKSEIPCPVRISNNLDSFVIETPTGVNRGPLTCVIEILCIRSLWSVGKIQMVLNLPFSHGERRPLSKDVGMNRSHNRSFTEMTDRRPWTKFLVSCVTSRVRDQQCRQKTKVLVRGEGHDYPTLTYESPMYFHSSPHVTTVTLVFKIELTTLTQSH